MHQATHNGRQAAALFQVTGTAGAQAALELSNSSPSSTPASSTEINTNAQVDSIVEAGAAAEQIVARGVIVDEPKTETKPAETKPDDDDVPIKVLSHDGRQFDLSKLFEILSYCRGHDSVGERVFINRVLIPFLQSTPYEFVIIGPNNNESMANFVLDVPCKEKKDIKPKTLFSCHIDTVHPSSLQQVRQKLNVDAALDHVFAHPDEKMCLGADDGAGVWVLMEMIRFGIPGTYVFHRGEERGCIGSRWIESNRKEWLKNYSRAVAFDRKGATDVITHQRNSSTASFAFASTLAKTLNEIDPENLNLSSCPNGIYTDTANYTECIPECTNISVGYEDAHGSNEYLDYGHLQFLLKACLSIDWEALPTERKPVARYSQGGYHGSGGYHAGRAYGGGGYGGGGYSDDDNDGFGAPASFQSARNDATSSSSSSSASNTQRAGVGGTNGAAASPSPTPSPSSSATDLRGKEEKKNKAVPAPYKYQPAIIEEFLALQRSDMYAYLLEEEMESIVDLVGDLLAEIAGLRAKLAYREDTMR